MTRLCRSTMGLKQVRTVLGDGHLVQRFLGSIEQFTLVIGVQINELEGRFVLAEPQVFDPDDLTLDGCRAVGMLDVDIENRADLGLAPAFTGHAHA